MDTGTLVVVVLVALVVLIAVLLVVLLSNRVGARTISSQGAVSSSLRSLVDSQRTQTAAISNDSKQDNLENLALAAAAESNDQAKATGSRLTLAKRLMYANWPITPFQFRIIQAVVTVLVLIPTCLTFTIFIQLLVLLLTPLLVGSVLDWAVNRRFKAFDEDYPVLLLSYVSLLKTGMATLTGLESAAKGLEEGSLVRAEVELLIERLRVGLTEEQAINAFGEDIPHPELELFVQSLLLSRRVGGQLSQTLERLAKQVRKRQQFRQQAVAAVGMERSSLKMIGVIMSALMCYLAFQSPELVFPTFSHELGRKIFEGGIALIISGFYWSRVVTNIKV